MMDSFPVANELLHDVGQGNIDALKASGEDVLLACIFLFIHTHSCGKMKKKVTIQHPIRQISALHGPESLQKDHKNTR